MRRVLCCTFLSTTLLFASCAATQQQSQSPEIKEMPKVTEWLCSVSFDFREEIPVVFLGTGPTREAALKEARADCARRRMETADKAACLSAVAIAERCASPD